MISGRAGRGAVAAAGTSPGPGLGSQAASGPGGALGGRRVISQYGRGVRSAQFSRSVVSNSLQLHELHHARPPCPSPTP